VNPNFPLKAAVHGVEYVNDPHLRHYRPTTADERRAIARRGRIEAYEAQQDKRLEINRLQRILRFLIRKPEPSPENLAKVAMWLGEKELDIRKPLRVLPMDVQQYPDRRGYVLLIDPQTIYIAPNQCVCRVVKTVLHECRHAFQLLNRFAGDAEADADSFASNYMRKFFSPAGCICGN
jgi:hypothetical protein